MFATSKDIAAYFEKDHMHVMRDIRTLLDVDPSLSSNFGLIAIDALVGYGWRKFPAYEMDRKGFSMLAFGFTGEKAGRALRRCQPLQRPLQRARLLRRKAV